MEEVKKINICEYDDKCVHCGKDFKYRKRNYKAPGDDLYEVSHIVAHSYCSKSYNKVQRLKRKLLDEEFTMFCRIMAKS